jgi:hypothetical protein
MRVTVLFLLLSTLAFGQKVEYYKYGYEGIEKFGNWNDSTLIYSHHKAKPTIRREVCDSVLIRYIKKKPLPSKLVLKINKATVYGSFKIKRKGSLIHLVFHYEKVVWKDSITEKPIQIIKKKKKVANIKTK